MAGRRAVSLLAGAATLIALAGCDGEEGEAGREAAEVGEEVGVGVVDPWVRAAVVRGGDSAAGVPAAPVNSAAYLVIRNGGREADALLAVETDIADTAELHSVSIANGVMRMRPVDSVAVPAGGEAVLEPGGLHVMLVGLHRGLADGDSVALTLRLRSGRTLQVTAPVMAAARGQ